MKIKLIPPNSKVQFNLSGIGFHFSDLFTNSSASIRPNPKAVDVLYPAPFVCQFASEAIYYKL